VHFPGLQPFLFGELMLGLLKSLILIKLWNLSLVFFSVQQKCIGQEKCTVTISPNNFGGDPCPNVMKKVAVEAICSPKIS
jgi:Galactose binding lectin domain